MKSLKLACVAMLALPLAACGGGGNDAADDDYAPAEETVASASAPSGEPSAFSQCKACHSVQPGVNGIGPTLAGIYEAPVGNVPGFDYSPAMAAMETNWDEAALDAYLDNPRAYVPGTKMAYVGLKDETKRREVVEYLKTL